MLVIGLTGGICSGKTTISELFSKYDTTIIDADEISRNLLSGSIYSEPSLALSKVLEHFGKDIFDTKGFLIREELRNIIFTPLGKTAQQNKAISAKKILENILHPEVFLKINNSIKFYKNEQLKKYIIVSIPLLLETADLTLFDRLLIVDVTEETQIRRCMERDNSSLDTIQKIIKTQIPRTKRITYADDIIDNELPAHLLTKTVSQLHLFYQKLSQQTA